MPRLSLLFSALVLVLAGCDPAGFTVRLQGETTVQGNPLGGLLTAFEPIGSFSNLDFDQQQDFRNQGVSKEQVKSVRVMSVVLTVADPESQDFSFLDRLSFHAQAGDDEAELASKAGISTEPGTPPNATLSLDVTDAELQPYVTSPSMSIVVRGSGRQPPQATRIHAEVRLRV